MLSASRVLAEMNLLLAIICAAGAEATVRYENATPDQLLIQWCLIGGCCGAACSLRYFRPTGHFEGSCQFVTNVIISAVLSPIIVDGVAFRCDLPVGLRLALPISWAVGLLGQVGVGRAMPFLEKWFDRKGNQIAGK